MMSSHSEQGEEKSRGFSLDELIEAGNISSDAKLEFLDEAFVEYDMGNSSFDDALMDIFFAMCETK